MKLQTIAVADIQPDPLQPRNDAEYSGIEELAQNMAQHTQLSPIIVFSQGKSFILVDGHRRWLAASLAKMTQLNAMVLDMPPTPSELLAMQLVIACHRRGLSCYDQYLAFERLREMEKLSLTQLAQRLTVPKSKVTRILSIGKLLPEVQDLVREGNVGSAKAYALARMSPERQRTAFAALTQGKADRSALEQMARDGGLEKIGRRLSRVAYDLPRCTILVQSPEPLTLDNLDERLQTLLRAVRKAKRDGYDVKTLAQMLKTKAQPVSHNREVNTL